MFFKFGIFLLIAITGKPVFSYKVEIFIMLKPPIVMPLSIITLNCSLCLDLFIIFIRASVASIPSIFTSIL